MSLPPELKELLEHMTRHATIRSALRTLDDIVIERRDTAYKKELYFDVLAISICGIADMPRVNKETLLRRIFEMEWDAYSMVPDGIKDPTKREEAISASMEPHIKFLDAIGEMQDAADTYATTGKVPRIRITTDQWLNSFNNAKQSKLGRELFFQLSLRSLPEGVEANDPRVKEALKYMQQERRNANRNPYRDNM